jgi:hypothetical protein
MLSKPKVGLGIVSYGPQSPRFWKQLVEMTAYLYKDGIEFDQIYHSGVSNTDINRNNVTDEFLKESTAEWLWWIDADNPPPIGALHRLLSLNLPAVSGVYYSGQPEGEMGMIAYIRNQQGAYNSVSRMRDWERGELLQVDAVGMGCFLTHRSVYEKILEQYAVYQRYSGGMLVIKKDDVVGSEPTLEPPEHEHSQKMVDGLFYEPMVEVTHSKAKFPFFMCQFMRTEDMPFCELVRGSGQEIWLDTSVEVPHVKDQPITGAHYRANQRQIPDPLPQEVDVV